MMFNKFCVSCNCVPVKRMVVDFENKTDLRVEDPVNLTDLKYYLKVLLTASKRITQHICPFYGLQLVKTTGVRE